MQLYVGMSQDFIRETTRNQIAETLRHAFEDYYRYKPSPGEISSWRNSLRAMKDVLVIGGLVDHGVILEYQLPLSSKRIDCLVCGQGTDGGPHATLIELKQWERCTEAAPEQLVTTWVGGAQREVLHPSVQVGQYRQYLADTVVAFHADPDPIGLSSCAYLHNYQIEQDDPLVSPKFESDLAGSPLFDLDQAEDLAAHLGAEVGPGGGASVLGRIAQSPSRPSRKLMDHVAGTIKQHSPWVLLDEQLVVFQHIKELARNTLKRGKKQVVIVRGGPGTGKSVIAVNLLADLLREGVNAQHATGSKAFTETLWRVVGRRAKAMFKYFNSFRAADADAIDVLICDEAHRIRETSNSIYVKRDAWSTTPQVRELLDAARVSVFFIDDKQGVRPNEIGSTAHIRRHAVEIGAEVEEFELDIQFRCAGSDGFVNWIDNTLGIKRTANILWGREERFDFQIVPSPHELESRIRALAAGGNSARVAAGFCWKWSKPRPDGTLVDDVVIGDYIRPWDAKPGKWKLAPGIPPAALWATDPAGIDQIGCVYNIQGFELDYIGVIWGPDLRYDWDQGDWVGDKAKSADAMVKRAKTGFADLIKNTYRVLLSRGLKGCYVHFMDKDTERYVRSRMERPGDSAGGQLRVAEPVVRPTSGGAAKPSDIVD